MSSRSYPSGAGSGSDRARAAEDAGVYRIAYLRRHQDDDPDRAVPARLFLKTVPPAVAARLRAVVIAVAQAPPHKFAGGGKWEAMSGDLAGIYEVRTDGPPHRTHYRLFCVLDTKALDSRGNAMEPLLVLLDGAAKPFRTRMPTRCTRGCAGCVRSTSGGSGAPSPSGDGQFAQRTGDGIEVGLAERAENHLVTERHGEVGDHP